MYVDGEVSGHTVSVVERVLVGERTMEIVALEGETAGYVVSRALLVLEDAPALAPTIRYPYPETLLFLGTTVTM